MKKLYLSLIISVLGLFGYGQVTKQVKTSEQIWLGYFNQTRLSNKWGLWTDVHFRTTGGFVEEPSKFLFRAGLMY